ncbi:MAG: plasmid mobilization relaxosome protein MobC [Hyphomicrobium sp.]
MGRPRANQKRDQQLNLSLTEAEYAEVYWRARRAGMRLVDYGRCRLLGGASQPVIPLNTAPVGDHLLFAELKRLGNNLNQLVRICHAHRQPPPAALVSLLERIRDLINRGVRA